MNWKQWLTFSPYKKLWTLWGKRPWTYIRRDFYHVAPLINIGAFFWGGVMFGVYHPEVLAWISSNMWALFLFVFLVWLIGGLQCHFFWGTKYIPGQGGNGGALVKCRDCRFRQENYLTSLSYMGVYRFSYCQEQVSDCFVVDPDTERKCGTFEEGTPES